MALTAKQSILIVDDEFGLGEMLREMLREAGFDVTLAINGQTALEILEEGTVDLVLTDMMMPVMDGAELAAAMRNDHRYRDTPIVMMTSLPTSRPRPEGLFDAILRKPFTPELLLDTIVRCLSTRDAADAERSANGQPGPDGDATV